MRFSSMILERLTSGREDASDECMGIGRPTAECEDYLLQIAVRCLLMTHEEDPDQVDQRAREKLHHFATLSWSMSHHAN